MSVSVLSPIRALGSVPGLLHVASLFRLLLLLLKAAQLYLHKQWLLKALQQFPSPPSHWLYGHSREVGKRGPGSGRAGRDGLSEHGIHKFLAPLIGCGLLLLNGQTWFQRRRMLTPAFHYDILKPYVGLMAKSIQVMLDKWEQLVAQDPRLEIVGPVSLMTLDTIMKCAFSHQGSVQTDGPSDPAEEGAAAKAGRDGEREEEEALGFPGHPPPSSGDSPVPQLCPASGWPLFRDHLDQMPYTTMCIKEALRLYLPVPVIGRELSKPITFPDGRSLPAGMSITTPTNLSICKNTWELRHPRALVQLQRAVSLIVVNLNLMSCYRWGGFCKAL
uniref:Uncharacterized protein n=1 Tax=Sus scrofa TaxID=9823 RepID=A0A4X1WAR4_PIG